MWPKFASLDHISKGRAGWNLVTSGNPDEALNFGRDAHLDHACATLRPAREFYDVVTGLWDSWADDAFLMDPESGLFFDSSKCTSSTTGRIPDGEGAAQYRPAVQGWPVIVQAGASEAGKQIAAETAEMVFGASSTLEAAQAYYADVKGRMPALGRDPRPPEDPARALVILGETEAEAQAKRARSTILSIPDSGLANLSVRLGVDASGFDLDAPLPEIPETNASKTSQAQILDYARRTGATVRDLARKVRCLCRAPFRGDARTGGGPDGGMAGGAGLRRLQRHVPFVPQGLDDVVDTLVPELQRRGLFRRDYAGTTLRDHLGLPRPAEPVLRGGRDGGRLTAPGDTGLVRDKARCLRKRRGSPRFHPDKPPLTLSLSPRGRGSFAGARCIATSAIAGNRSADQR